MGSANRLNSRMAPLALPLSLLLGGMLCGPTGPYLDAAISRDPLRECQQFTCPIAKGTTLRIHTGFHDTDVMVSTEPSHVSYMPAGIVETVSIEEGVLTVQGRTAGTTQLRAIIDGQSITQTISVAPRTRTEIQIVEPHYPQSLSDAGLAIATNTELSLFARHSGPDGEPIVAEGIERWSLGAEAASRLEERSLWTLLTGPQEESLNISAGVGESLLLEVLRPSALARVTLFGLSEPAAGEEPATIAEGETIVLNTREFGRGLAVAPMTSSGKMILGIPWEVVEVSGEAARVDSVDPEGSFLFLRPNSVGTGALRLRVGERVLTYPIRVDD